jgi:hypothetical protein
VRINVYAEEMTTEVEVVTKVVDDAAFGRRTFYGIRLYLASPPELHAQPDDDDRSAITLWVKWTAAEGSDFELLLQLLTNLYMNTTRARSMAERGEV